MHRTPTRRNLLNRVWTLVGDQPVEIPRGLLQGWKFASGGGQPGYLLGASEPDLQRQLRDNLADGEVFYDIGANVGFFSLIGAKLVGPSGAVYAFEPMALNLSALRRNIALNDLRHVHVEPVAVTNRSGTVAMDLGVNQATGRIAETGVSVPAVSVDEFVAAGNRPPDLIKIDVEGAEHFVIAGMADTLKIHRPTIACELHHPADSEPLIQISALLRDADYIEQLIPLDGGTMPHLLGRPRMSPALPGL